MEQNMYTPPNSDLLNSGSENHAYKDQKYTKVGGWLLFLCISLTILTPLANIAAIGNTLATFSQLTKQFPKMGPVLIIEIILIIFIIAFSIFSGIRLWSIHDKAIETTKIFLIINIITVVLISILPMFGGLPDSANSQIGANATGAIFRGLVFAGIWTSYLNKSIRVARTFDLPTLI